MTKGRARRYRTIRELKHTTPGDAGDETCDECGRRLVDGHADWCLADDDSDEDDDQA